MTMDLETTTALELGFSLMEEASKTTNRQRYNSFVEDVQLKSVQNLVVLTEELAMRGLDPSASLKTILDISEFQFKASGMAAKQAAQISNAAGPAYQLHINFGSKGKESFNGVSITSSPAEPAIIDVTPEPPTATELVSANIQSDTKH